jgi:hypothetical protein
MNYPILPPWTMVLRTRKPAEPAEEPAEPVVVLARIVQPHGYDHYVLRFTCPWWSKHIHEHEHAVFGPGGVLGGPRSSHCHEPGAPRQYFLEVVNPEQLQRAPQSDVGYPSPRRRRSASTPRRRRR